MCHFFTESKEYYFLQLKCKESALKEIDLIIINCSNLEWYQRIK
jgi:hypothetical protein